MTIEEKETTLNDIVNNTLNAIETLKEVPIKLLYACLFDEIDLGTYHKILSVLEKRGVIKIENNLITFIEWI